MQTFDLHILGCGSALPTQRHLPTSQVINLREKLLMIDCGEGAQLAWRRTHLSPMKLGHIFISHAHGDHVFGLPGLISTMGLLGRTATLHIFGPAELKSFLDIILQQFCAGLEYEVVFTAVDTRKHEVIFEDRSMEVTTLPLHHLVPCCGFLIKEKPTLPHIRREMIDFYEIPNWAINNIKQGADWTMPDGTIVPHTKLTSPPDPVRSYAYCSDTMPVKHLPEWIEGVDTLFHEATFADSDAQRANQVGHSTARQAATIAKEAKVKRLVIGHFSARYDDEQILLKEAQEVFPNTILASEGMLLTL